MSRSSYALPRNGKSSPPPTQMTRAAAPWELAAGGQWPVEGRHDASGQIVEGRQQPVGRKDIVRESLDKILHHLTIACLWPGDWAQRLDVVGAYRFYVLEFAPKPGVGLYIQVWSEPGDPLLFEVSSGHQHVPTETYLSQEMREALLSRGFEIGGPAKNFRKKVVIDGKPALRALAREMLAIAVDVFRYDGSSPLKFRLHQDSRVDPARVFRAIQPDDFRRLLERWGVAAKFVPTGEPIIQARSAGIAFLVHFHVECPPPFTKFEAVTLTAPVKIAGGQAPRIANDVNTRMILGKAVATSPHELALSSTIVVGGGVAPDCLRRQVLGWVEEVREVVKKRS